MRAHDSLLCSSLCGVRHLCRVCSSICGPLGVAHPFHPSLLGGVPVRFCGGLADSLLRCPTRALCFSLHRSRVSIPFASSPLTPYLRWLYPSFARGRSCDGGVSPCGGFRRSPWDSQWLCLYRLTPALVSLRGLGVCLLGLRLVFTPFPCAAFRRCYMTIVHFFMHVSA